MIDNHLTDIDIQQYVLNKADCNANIIMHMHDCEYCKTKAETYKLLFFEIKQQPKSAFDFDLSGLVLKQLPQAKPGFSLNSLPGYSILLSFFAAVGISSYLYKAKIVYFFKTYILGITSGISSIVIFLVVATFLIFLIFQCIEMYRKYQRKIDDLNFY
jgi:hypothetical protein